MRNLVVNNSKHSKINKTSTDIFRSILADVSMDYCGRKSAIPTQRHEKWRRSRAQNIKCLYCVGRVDALPMSHHWMDGIGPSEQKNDKYHWGGVVDNSFGTREFMELCSQIGCEPYLTAI